MIRTAKEQFVNSPHRVEFEKMVDTNSFQAACDYAMLMLMEESPPAADVAKGWDSWSRCDGARRVLAILKTIHEPIKEQKPLKNPSLHYELKQPR